MKKVLFVMALMATSLISAKAQKVMAEGTIVYDVTVTTENKDPKLADAFDGATTSVYIKGSKSRTETTSALGTEVTIHDSKEGNAVILKEYSDQKLMITLTKADWLAKNKAYRDISFEFLPETKVIAGYTCKKALAKMANGKTFVVFYTTDITVPNNEYNHAFKNLPGLAMEYEIEMGKSKIKYTANKVDFGAVAASKFDAPTSGYRVMTYEENQKIKRGGA